MKKKKGMANGSVTDRLGLPIELSFGPFGGNGNGSCLLLLLLLVGSLGLQASSFGTSVAVKRCVLVVSG